MIVDKCPPHPLVDDLKANELIFYPPNTTTKMQPMNQGVFRSFTAIQILSAILQALLEDILPQRQHVRGHDFGNCSLGMYLTNNISKLLQKNRHKF